MRRSATFAEVRTANRFEGSAAGECRSVARASTLSPRDTMVRPSDTMVHRATTLGPRDTMVRAGDTTIKTSTTLADLLTALLAANPFSAMRASLWR
jgi:hypothetical protein